MAKGITFDINIIETLYASLRQSQTIVRGSSGERHTRARMDDVEYLVEDNEMDDFCLSSEMNGTHGKSTFEDGPGQQLLRRAAHGKLARWGASWEQNATVGNVPTIISA